MWNTGAAPLSVFLTLSVCVLPVHCVCVCVVSCDSAYVNIGGTDWEYVCFIGERQPLFCIAHSIAGCGLTHEGNVDRQFGEVFNSTELSG